MKTIRDYINLIESAQTPVAEGKNNIDDKIIHLMTNGIPADEIARKLDIPVEWVHEVAKYNMPDSAIDYNDPRNSTQGRERFGEQGVAENTGRSLDNAHQRAVIKINKMLKDPSISPVRRAELEQWKKEQMASMKMARGASIIPKNKLPLPEQGVAEDQTTRTCPTCDGSGEDALDPTKSCRRCGGKGYIPFPKEQGVAEGKGLAKKVKIVKGPDAGKTGWIREVKHGAFKGAPKTYYIDLDDGGQANNLPATALRLVKEQGVAEGEISQQYTVAVDCGEDGTFTVKVHAGDKGEALRKAQKIVRNEYDTYPEGARIVGQGVAEDLIDHDAAEPLARHFAELYYNGLSSADEAKMAARVYQQVVDGEMSIEQLKQHIAKLEKEKGVAEGHADQQRKIFKKNGEPVGEVGIDRESSPGVGQWYMKHYASGKDLVGYDSYEEAVEELKHCMKQGMAEGDVIPFKRPESKIKPEVRRVFIRHLLDQGYTNDEISRMNDQQFTKAYYGIKGKTKVKDVRPNWTDDLPDELDEEITPEAMAKPKIQVKEQGVAEALSKTDLLKQVSAELNNPEFRKKPVDPTKSFTRGDHWQGAKPGDYGYTGYQGHGMPTDKAERERIRADKKKQQDK